MNGEAEGFGFLKYIYNGDAKALYSFTGMGEIHDGKLNGLAVIVGGVKFIRIGQMKDGLRHGYGTAYRPGGTLSYEGNFINSMRHGHGRY